MNPHTIPSLGRARTRRSPRNRVSERTVQMEMPTWTTCPETQPSPKMEPLLIDQPVQPRFF